MRSRIILLTLTAFLTALVIVPARANVIYSYTGNHFTFATSPYSTSDHVSIVLEFTTVLAPSLPLGAVSPVAFSFFDGHQTITSAVFGALFLIAWIVVPGWVILT